ncbi:hypothetical protein A2714_02095 [Candidatus Woesebacteria bacterium RIFCSPHIGHO2_01_FULL_38_9]|uniref:LytR/CpsA/Psr regulator C-terminal domain-containing protein n=2 Tax=Candidatus Woeseibacteriota TaxID=1752722 RepID=A0A1F7Y2T5_9BACT|nr:MAG: hypothetical protein A2714_02095 [Candidatus Woesebacteria bacterium RIFCSPHIGHO2_01_FULL_38_9]OGM59376.1 MAG: hypothetical protein A3A75_03425 [Candidatus Woesebacteria bacterium RIFCSPLOWO2_01_FULL_39_10]
MLTNTKKVIAITKDKVIASEVKLDSKKLVSSFEFGWKPETLDLVFNEVKKRLKTSQFRILVSDALSYVVRTSVPSEVTKDEEREYVGQNIQEKIPDDLKEGDWDYKIVGSEKKGDSIGSTRDVIVFAIVSDFYGILKNAIKKTNLQVEAIEPETVARTRDVNPIIGIAMKEDISGKDEEVLNLKPSESETKKEVTETRIQQSSESDDKDPQTGGKRSLKVRIIFFISIIFFLLGVLFFIRSNPFESNEEFPTPTITPTTSVEKVSPTPEAVEKTLDLSKFKVQVQNGTGTEGGADEVAGILETEGFTDIETANADSFDYQETELRIKDAVPEEVIEIVEKALIGRYTLKVVETSLDASSDFDIVVIVGVER